MLQRRPQHCWPISEPRQPLEQAANAVDEMGSRRGSCCQVLWYPSAATPPTPSSQRPSATLYTGIRSPKASMLAAFRHISSSGCYIRIWLPSPPQNIIMNPRQHLRLRLPPRERRPRRVGRRRQRRSAPRRRAVVLVADARQLPGSRSHQVRARRPERRAGRDGSARVAARPGEICRRARDATEPPDVFDDFGRRCRR